MTGGSRRYAEINGIFVGVSACWFEIWLGDASAVMVSVLCAPGRHCLHGAIRRLLRNCAVHMYEDPTDALEALQCTMIQECDEKVCKYVIRYCFQQVIRKADGGRTTGV